MGFGRLGAQGVPGAVALSTTLDELAEVTHPYRTTPPERLRNNLLYLTRSHTGYTFMQDCGIRMDRHMITAWLAEERTPAPDHQRRLEDAFRLLRRRNMATSMTRRLNTGGGTRVEIYPVDQSEVDEKHRRNPRWRHKNIYRWDPIIVAWSHSDLDELTLRWRDVITDLDSDWRMFEYVTHIGFGA